jgi:predicted aconitase with swiveling domain
MSGKPAGRPLRGRTLVAGRASGTALVLDEPLSFWGGMDPQTGRLIDPHHPQQGAGLGASILVMPSGRGSSSSSSVLAEAVRLGTSPAAIVLLTADPIVALGSIVAGELYGRAIPVLVLEPTGYASIRSGDAVEVQTQGGAAFVLRKRPGSRDQS